MNAIRGIRQGYGTNPAPKIREHLNALHRIPVSITARYGGKVIDIWEGSITQGKEDEIAKAVRMFKEQEVAEQATAK